MCAGLLPAPSAKDHRQLCTSPNLTYITFASDQGWGRRFVMEGRLSPLEEF
jgi:hypothetical protein